MRIALVAICLAGCAGAPPTAPPAPPTPSPTPTVTPSPVAEAPACPPLTRWRSGIHNITDADNQPAETPSVGGHVVIDSTPLFDGAPCNAERPCAAPCEDPRGGAWDWSGPADARAEVREHGYQLRFTTRSAGTYTWRVCPRADAMDGLERPLETRGEAACTAGAFTVSERS